MDRVAQTLITAAGIGTIAAVLLVCVFLFSVAIPLFRSTRVEPEHTFAEAPGRQSPLRIGIDEYWLMGWSLGAGGQLQAFGLSDGAPIGKPIWIRAEDKDDAAALSCAAFDPDGKSVALGFADGSVRLGAIGFKTRFLPEVPKSLVDLDTGDSRPYQDGIAQRTSEGQIRLQQLALALSPRTPPVSASAIEQIDFSVLPEGPVFCARSADGRISVNAVHKRTNLLTDEDAIDVETAELPLPEGVTTPPRKVLITGTADNVYAIWSDGRLVRYETRDLSHPRQVEAIRLTPQNDAQITAADFLLGKATLVTGDSLGRVRAWFSTKPARADTRDGVKLVMGHELPPCEGPVESLTVSSRSRLIAVGDSRGHVRLEYVTSERSLAEVKVDDAPVRLLAFAPKEDGLVAATDKGVALWSLDAGYPEVTLATLTRPVWYETYNAPAQVWQATGGNDAFEPKFGLWPLVFGTLKATFYSMLFGAPLALLAAIYTSEFLGGRARARIKPLIETMASLPSVVLGFLAGLVIAPVIETIVPATIASFFTVPLAMLSGAFLWQMLSSSTAIRFARWRFVCMILLLPLGLLAAYGIGPGIERWLFDGDLRLWLDHQGDGAAIGGWVILLLPLSSVASLLFMVRTVHPWLRGISGAWTRRQAASVDFLKFLVGLALAVAIALCVGMLLIGFGFDPRGVSRDSEWALVGTYVQRNAMVVGFMMGFAIVPLIYTLADDALTTVPAHLRSASLAAGATPWQTLTRIVIPTAMSGLFAAVMIGFGRAVGETMIVLMAAGNTPITRMNIFEGFRTLSASIAVELPEAAAGTTHYRTLFLAALTLFVMTVLVNTGAEVVRQRFRRRAYEL